MKKKIALLLALVLAFSLIACSGSGEAPSIETTAPLTEQPATAPTEAPTQPTSVPTETPTEPTTAPTDPTSIPTEAPTEKPTEAPTQKPTQAPTQKPTESDHIHDMVLRTTIIKATHDKEGLDEVRCSWCSHTIQEKTPKISVPYLVGIELVNAVRPNACYLSDGTPILEKIYGTNYCQVGDVLTYKVIMSDGSNEGFTVKNELPMVADMEVNGNLITVTVTDQRFANDAFQIDVISNDIDNNWTSKGIFTYIVLGNIKFTDLEPNDISVEVKNYAVNQGMESNILLLNQFNDGTLTSYTDGDPSKSITGTAQYGFDDYIIVEEHENWLEMLFDLIDEYKSRGFTKVYMYYAFGAFEFKAC